MGIVRLGAISLLTQLLSLLITSNDSSNYFQSLFKGRAGGRHIRLPWGPATEQLLHKLSPWGP
jgi:hypothetical protein